MKKVVLLFICLIFYERLWSQNQSNMYFSGEMNSWAAEAKFLKAYYHFLLFTYYGPIPIVDENLPIEICDKIKNSEIFNK